MISVIIPVLNEAENLRRLLPAMENTDFAVQVIVVDGGSEDGSLDVVRRSTATGISSARGRGNQLLAGVERASGDILLFLHADSIFDRRGLEALREQMAAAPEWVGGNFRVVFEGEREFCHDLTRFYAWMRRRGNYYGDSGIFVRREVYDRIGGIRPMPLMEDFNFVRRMERAGPTVCIDEPPIITSARRFEGRTWPNIIWGWIKIHLLYALQVSPQRLSRMYENLK